MKRIFFIILILCTSWTLARGQTATATIDDHAATSGQIVIPVEVTDFNNVGAITINIAYDQNVASYDSFQNAALSGMLVNAYPSGSNYIIGISWTATYSGSTVNGTLLELVMNYNSGTTELAFQESTCEITDFDGNIIPVVYDDGSIFPDEVVPVAIEDMTNQTPITTIQVPINVDFSGVSSGVGSFNFEIEYDETYLDFQQLTNTFESGIQVNQLSNPSRIALIWAGSSGSFLNGKLLDMEFTYYGSTTELTFLPEACNISDFNAVTLNGAYTNGTISQDPATSTGVTIATIQAQAGTEILLPITVDNFNNVGAFTYNIQFNTQYLEFIELTNIHADVNSGQLLYNAPEDVVIIDWNAISSGVTLTDGTELFSLKFNYSGTNTNLNFLEDQCSMADYDANPVSAIYTNGAVEEIPGENATASMDTVASPTYTQVNIPLEVTKFIDVGAITLEIQFDNTILSYLRLNNWNSDLANHGSEIVSVSDGILSVSWTVDAGYGQGVTIPDNDKLFDIQFDYRTGTSELTFLTESCEVANYDTEPINVYYSDGQVTNTVQVEIKAFLQGLYNTGTGQMNKAQDWDGSQTINKYPGTVADLITVELHDPADYSNIVYTINDVELNQDGTASFELSELYMDTYYLTIKNRNHLETVSANPVDCGNGNTTYDFTISAGQAYESNMLDLGGGNYGFYAGDVNQDGFININDSGPTINAVRNGDKGYVATDINGDGYVNINDSGPVINNVRAGKQKETP